MSENHAGVLQGGGRGGRTRWSPQGLQLTGDRHQVLGNSQKSTVTLEQEHATRRDPITGDMGGPDLEHFFPPAPFPLPFPNPYPLGFGTMVALSHVPTWGSHPSQCSSQEGKTTLGNTPRV